LTAGDSGLLSSLQAALIDGSPPTACAVDYFDANRGTTPTAAFLSQYDVVLAYNDDNYPYADPVGLGNALAAYFDNGGRVVIALFADAGYPIGGAFADNYLLLNPVNVGMASDSFSYMSALINPPDPAAVPLILGGVNSISGTGWHGTLALQNGGIAVASWASGEPLAVVGTVTDSNGNLRNIVDLNILPTDIATGAWTGDGIQLLRNALLYR
jgi:hypothetical protein